MVHVRVFSRRSGSAGLVFVVLDFGDVTRYCTLDAFLSHFVVNRNDNNFQTLAT